MTLTESKSQRCVLRSQQDKDRLLAFIDRLPLDQPFEFSWQPWSPKRSLSANALYWKWLTLLAEYFSAKGFPLNRKGAHDIMRHLHLGYTSEQRYGKTVVIPAQLKSTRSLSRRAMCEYMTKIDHWALEKGCLLPHPEDDEYAQYLESIS